MQEALIVDKIVVIREWGILNDTTFHITII